MQKSITFYVPQISQEPLQLPMQCYQETQL